jgi:hypothetical protein
VRVSGAEWSELVRGLPPFSRQLLGEKLVAEAREQFRNLEKGERPLLKPLPGNDWRSHSRLRRPSTRYSELRSL